MSEPKLLRFIHRFPQNISCEIQMFDQPPESGQMSGNAYYWPEPPTPKFVAEARVWLLHIAQTLTDRWQTPILYTLQTAPNGAELWAFVPVEGQS